ncbi:MAG: hypothetical protein LIQ30_13445 [Planctomycetes bacterium]|nr:hypothetical protein [Planctomycetota bacterium]MCC8116406.1 hypothetical protein [Planctomycetota bacterium]
MDNAAGSMETGSLPSMPDDSVQQVETERIGGPQFTYEKFSTPGGGMAFGFSSYSDGSRPLPKAPVAATWICLALAWLALGSKIPFTVLIGLPFNIAALFLATVSLGRGSMFTGFSVLLLGTVGSIVVYLVGLFRFLVML